MYYFLSWNIIEFRVTYSLFTDRVRLWFFWKRQKERERGSWMEADSKKKTWVISNLLEYSTLSCCYFIWCPTYLLSQKMLCGYLRSTAKLWGWEVAQFGESVPLRASVSKTMKSGSSKSLCRAWKQQGRGLGRLWPWGSLVTLGFHSELLWLLLLCGATFAQKFYFLGPLQNPSEIFSPNLSNLLPVIHSWPYLGCPPSCTLGIWWLIWEVE